MSYPHLVGVARGRERLLPTDARWRPRQDKMGD